MDYLLIIFFIALALAPLSHFAPSKRQRRIAHLREFAATQGLFVEFRSLPGADKERFKRTVSAPASAVYYGKRLPPAKGGRVRVGAWRRDDDDWYALDRKWRVPAPLAGLSVEGVVAASVDDTSCGVYWQESGGEAEIETLRDIFEAWSESILH